MEYGIILIANIIALGRFWVKLDDDDSPMILNILMDIMDLQQNTRVSTRNIKEVKTTWCIL